MTAWIQNLRLGRLAAAALLACLATALLAASAPAKPTPTANARAAVLQQGVDGLVATGVPGAILFVRDGAAPCGSPPASATSATRRR